MQSVVQPPDPPDPAGTNSCQHKCICNTNTQTIYLAILNVYPHTCTYKCNTLITDTLLLLRDSQAYILMCSMYHSFAHHILINSCTHMYIYIYLYIRVTKPHTLTRVEFFICTLVSLFETPGSRYVYIMKFRNLWSFGDREKQQKDMRRNDMKRFSTELCRGEKDMQLRPSIHKAQAKNSQALDVHSVALQNKSSPPKNE